MLDNGYRFCCQSMCEPSQREVEGAVIERGVILCADPRLGGGKAAKQPLLEALLPKEAAGVTHFSLSSLCALC